MSISSLVVQTRPGAAEGVRDEITNYPGVEVHAETDDGRLVVTVDRPLDQEAAEIFDKFQRLEGVLSASLVFNYFEPDGSPDSGAPNIGTKEELS